MNKIAIKDLEIIKQKVQDDWSPGNARGIPRITVHMGTCGLAAGARKVLEALEQKIIGG